MRELKFDKIDKFSKFKIVLEIILHCYRENKSEIKTLIALLWSDKKKKLLRDCLNACYLSEETF